MSDSRAQRVADFIREEGSEIISRRLKDPRIAPMTTITSVEVSGDLSLVKIYVSVMGGQEAREATMTALNKGKGFFRTELGRRLSLRHVPEVVFRLDESMESGARILDILSKLSAGEDLPDSGEPGS
jgi:ribosome-binding factor A